MKTYRFKRENSIEEVIETLENKLNVPEGSVFFDGSRNWSLGICGNILGYPVAKFGAYRNYMGGGVRSGIKHNGEKARGNFTKGELFKNALLKIEKIINKDSEGTQSWEQNTGVLL